MPTRIPASERTSQKLEELLSQGVADGDARAELLKLAVRKIVEEALEAEVGEAVGRGYYENGAEPGAGYRNGYRRGRLRAAEGPIEYGVPQVADRAEPFVSRVRARLAGRTAELERLAVEMFARGLSTRDIEAAFQDETGTSLLSRTAVSQVTERLWQEYEAFAGRDLSEFAVAYFFVDGVAERLHAGMPREAVLCAWGITEEGQKVLLHLAPGTKEDTASCTAFFQDLKRRGLADPLLVVTDGAAGLIRAAETCFPRAVRQRCLVHRLRNLRSKAPESQWPEVAIRARACYEAASPALATLLRDDFIQAYERELPAVDQNSRGNYAAAEAISGAGEPLLNVGLRLSYAAMVSGYSRDMEREADQEGLKVLVSAGYAAKDMADMFRHMLAESPDRGSIETFFWGSHPRTAERIETIEQQLAVDSPTSGRGDKKDFDRRTGRVRLDNAIWDAYLGRWKLATAQIDRMMPLVPAARRASIEAMWQGHLFSAASVGARSRKNEQVAEQAFTLAASRYNRLTSTSDTNAQATGPPSRPQEHSLRQQDCLHEIPRASASGHRCCRHSNQDGSTTLLNLIGVMVWKSPGRR